MGFRRASRRVRLEIDGKLEQRLERGLAMLVREHRPRTPRAPQSPATPFKDLVTSRAEDRLGRQGVPTTTSPPTRAQMRRLTK